MNAQSDIVAAEAAAENGIGSDMPVATDAGPALEFEALSVRPLRHAAAPTMTLDLQIRERHGRQVYMIGLSIQLMIEPARREYDEPTRERLTGLFGAPERWGVTTRSLLWAQLDVVVPAFIGSTVVAIALPCSYDLEIAAAKYFYALPSGEAPLALHFNGMVYYPDESGGLRMVLVPWSQSIDFLMPVSVWRETIEHYYPGNGWAALDKRTLVRLERERVARGLPTFDACVSELLDEVGDG